MGQPTPPGENVPLFEGLDPSWNDFVGALPEDKRAELAPKLKERIDGYQTKLEPWEQFSKQGIDPQQVEQALSVFAAVETNPKGVYEAIGKALGITTQQAKEVVEEIEEGDEDDPRIATLKQQVDTLTQITLAQRQQEMQQKEQKEADAALEKEMTALKKKYSDVDEEEVIMRMLHKGLSAEQAYSEYSGKVSELRKTRPAPMLMSGGGNIPNRAIDPTKLDSVGTKNLVAQMMEHAVSQQKQS